MRKQALHPHTAAINQKQKNQSKRAKLEALSWLAQKFPCAFDNKHRIQPLSLGIMSEILSHEEEAAKAGISKSKLREAVVIFTRRVDYLACLKAREMRIDLNGNATQMVTEEDAERAALKLKKRTEKSVKNARRTPNTPERTSVSKGNTSFSDYPPIQGTALYCSEPTSSYQAQPHTTMSQRAPVVTVKHKQARPYDPDLVARLKEKLGISRKPEETDKA